MPTDLDRYIGLFSNASIFKYSSLPKQSSTPCAVAPAVCRKEALPGQYPPGDDDDDDDDDGEEDSIPAISILC
jgi:hypothetical protein